MSGYYKQHSDAFTRVSTEFTNKFYNMDQICFRFSPYLTFMEAETIVVEMEKRATSKYEGNWTTSDCIMFLRELLGNDRYNAIEMAWEIDNQAMITAYNSREELRTAYVHKLMMTEGTPEQVRANPNDYMEIKTTHKPIF